MNRNFAALRVLARKYGLTAQNSQAFNEALVATHRLRTAVVSARARSSFPAATRELDMRCESFREFAVLLAHLASQFGHCHDMRDSLLVASRSGLFSERALKSMKTVKLGGDRARDSRWQSAPSVWRLVSKPVTEHGASKDAGSNGDCWHDSGLDLWSASSKMFAEKNSCLSERPSSSCSSMHGKRRIKPDNFWIQQSYREDCSLARSHPGKD